MLNWNRFWRDLRRTRLKLIKFGHRLHFLHNTCNVSMYSMYIGYHIPFADCLYCYVYNLINTVRNDDVHWRLRTKEDLPWRDNWRGPPYHMIIHALQTRYSIWKRVYLKVVFKFFKCGIYYIIMKKSIFYDIKKYVCIANIFASPKNVFVWRYSAYFSPV